MWKYRSDGQVWIETVLYTLIGLVLIGVALAIITPKINASREKTLVEQAIVALNDFDRTIREVNDAGPGNVRNIQALNINKGDFLVDAANDRIGFYFEGFGSPYSEPGVEIAIGRVKVLTTGESSSNRVEASIEYTGSANLVYAGGLNEKKFSASSTPYRFSVENLGISTGQTVYNLRIEEISGR